MPPRRTIRRALWTLAFVAVAPVAAELATVHLRDGGQLTGDLAELADGVSLRNRAGLHRIPQSAIERVERHAAPPALAAEYARRLARLAPDDLAGHVALARWALARDRGDWARERCEHVLQANSAHLGAAALLSRLRRTDADVAARQAGPPTPPTMSPRDVNRLRLSELGEKPPRRGDVRLRVVGDTPRDALLKRIAAALHALGPEGPALAEQFRAADDLARLRLMVAHLGLRFADEVVVDGDPPPLDEFRREVLPVVRRSCARAGCHGPHGPAVAFRFPDGASHATEYAYAAFYLLDQLETSGGPLLNRAAPAQSVLLDYLLPREHAAHPHPPVARGRELHPPLRNRQDRRYSALVAWIESLAAPRPQYELDYAAPALQRRDPNAPSNAPNPSDPNRAAAPR